MKYLLIVMLSMALNKVDSQIVSWYFPEYKHYFRPNGDCNGTSIKSIWGEQYLKFRVYDSCRHVEISCYSRKDSALKERGIYYATKNIISSNSVVRQAGADSSRLQKIQYVVFNRVGIWRVYNKAGRVIRTIKYKPDEYQ